MAPSAPRGSILVVDDDDGFRYAATKALKEAGFAVSSAPNYREAIKALEDKMPVDLLVTDVHIGFTLARMARVRRPGLKVIYLAGFDVPGGEIIGDKSLRKPISNEQLVSEVRLAFAS
jgi:DNA-binding response OmpR family regulator